MASSDRNYHSLTPRAKAKLWQLFFAFLVIAGVIISGYLATTGASNIIDDPGKVNTAGGDRPEQVLVEGSNLMVPFDTLKAFFFRHLATVLLIPAFFISLAGLRYMAARNDPKKVTEAKQTVINLVLGTAILVGGLTIVTAIALLLMNLANLV